mgnify:CR=1 FL=1
MKHETMMQVENLKVHFDVSSEGDMPWTKRKRLQAVNGVSFELKSGETSIKLAKLNVEQG